MRKTQRRPPRSQRLNWHPLVTSVARAAAVLTGLGTLGCATSRTRTLQCHLQYADFVDTYPVPVTSNPYAVPSIDVHGRFQFRAVYVTEPPDLAGLNVYVYQTATPTPTLVHQLKLRPPYQSRDGHFGITGLNFVYDERARELQYWCGFAQTRGTP